MPGISQCAAARQTTPAPPREKRKTRKEEEEEVEVKEEKEEEEAVNPKSPPTPRYTLPLISFACAESGMISTERQSGGRTGE